MSGNTADLSQQTGGQSQTESSGLRRENSSVNENSNDHSSRADIRAALITADRHAN